METPLSSTRITRVEDEESNNKSVLKSRQTIINGKKHQERENSALIDITNGSPIVGLAMGSLKTPSSKKRMIIINNRTPGSGETLLRGQVKTLLQKVEEEGVISKICFEPNPLMYKRFMNSPMAVLAPTPANTPQVCKYTPQVCNFSGISNNGLESFSVSPVTENFNFTQMLNEVIDESNEEDKGEKDVITRSLFMDFSEKSHDSDSSYCNSSLWSVQVNASTSEECKDDEDYEDELCEEMSKISVDKGDKLTGKHTRFVYDSDREVEGELSSTSSSKGSI